MKMNSIRIVSLIIILNFHLNLGSDHPSDRIRLCIINCGQCKAMYGDFFLGHECAESCLIHAKGLADHSIRLPDCNSPKSILPYIKKVVADDTDDIIRK